MMKSTDVLLSVWIGVGGWTWPISSAVMRAGMACHALMNKAPILALAADDVTDLMIQAMFNTAQLFFGSCESSEIKK